MRRVVEFKWKSNENPDYSPSSRGIKRLYYWRLNILIVKDGIKNLNSPFFGAYIENNLYTPRFFDAKKKKRREKKKRIRATLSKKN